MTMKMLVAAALSAAVILPGAAMAGDAAAGAAKSASCNGCHRAGNPTAPVLDGMPEMYLVNAIMAYKPGGTRQNSTMTAMVAALSAGDAADIAAHYAGK